METNKIPGLRAGALGLAESVVMGIAGTGPAYSVAAGTATLVAATGVYAPASLLYCGLIMFGIVFAFRHLNRVTVNAGASYAWVSTIFSPLVGFSLAGRCSLVRRCSWFPARFRPRQRPSNCWRPASPATKTR
jgi:amino acid transporter